MSLIRQALQSALDENGGIVPFDTFMGIALHHADDGYYARNIRGIGGRGDFTTMPQMTPVLGKAIGAWLLQEADARGWKNFHVIECGPGDGSLAADVMKSFGWLGRRRSTLHLVETSNPLCGLQKRKVRSAVWHTSVPEALAACGGKALVFHNEFFDAFPCRVLRCRGEDWDELHLEVSGGRLAEIFLPPKRPLPDSTIFSHAWPEGQRVEVFEAVRDWMREISAAWSEGAMLAIDYGGAAKDIYHRRPAGTLRAYRGHQRLTGDAVYELPGRQDVTADVNFDDLRAWARELGWEAGADQALADFAPGAPGGDAFRCAFFRRS